MLHTISGTQPGYPGPKRRHFGPQSLHFTDWGEVKFQKPFPLTLQIGVQYDVVLDPGNPVVYLEVCVAALLLIYAPSCFFIHRYLYRINILVM